MTGRLARFDSIVFVLLLAALSAGVFLFGRANIVADSIDYYANLQRLSPVGGEPIVRNLHFAAQRSPGYSIAALLPHLFLVYVVDPVVGTTPEKLPLSAEEGPPGLIPAQPLLLRQVPFHDFSVRHENSLYQWKLALALALTSYGFLFAGLFAIASALRRAHPDLPGYSLLAAFLVGSPILVESILATPLYATLTAFGASALFCARFVHAMDTKTSFDGIAAGVWLGLVVLVRLETAVFAVALAAVLLLVRERALCLRLAAGASWAAVAWAAYNWRVSGTFVSFEILRGDINLFRVDFTYILRCLVHPASGLLFWSPLVCLGLLGLLTSKSMALRSLGIAALPLIALWVVRVPVMLAGANQAPQQIGGIPIMPPQGEFGAYQLIRSDINRYATMLAPSAVLGLRNLLARARIRRR